MPNMLYSTSEEQILQEIRELDYLPAPNPILVQLVSLLSQRQSTFERIQEIIEQDTALCSQILRLANSAYYGLRCEVHTIEKAIQILGTDEIRKLAIVLCIVHDFKPSRLPADFDLCHFWMHNLLAALICRQIAAITGQPSKEEAYLYGLLHDLGRLVMAIVSPKEFEALIRLSKTEAISLEEAEAELNIRHTAIGYAVAVYWNFPKPLCAVMGYHHNGTMAPHYKMECSLAELGAAMASFLLEDQGHQAGSFAPEPSLVEILNLTSSQVSEVLEKARQSLDEAREMANLFLGLEG